MKVQLINIGFGNIVSANRIIAIVSPESAPIKRIIQDARDRGMLIDATVAHRMESKAGDKAYDEDEFDDIDETAEEE